jgi:hypothetical protein
LATVKTLIDHLEDSFDFVRDEAAITREAALDFYVRRTLVAAGQERHHPKRELRDLG